MDGTHLDAHPFLSRLPPNVLCDSGLFPINIVRRDAGEVLPLAAELSASGVCFTLLFSGVVVTTFDILRYWGEHKCDGKGNF